MNKHYKLLLAGAGFAAMMTASPVLAQDQETAQDEAQQSGSGASATSL